MAEVTSSGTLFFPFIHYNFGERKRKEREGNGLIQLTLPEHCVEGTLQTPMQTEPEDKTMATEMDLEIRLLLFLSET